MEGCSFLEALTAIDDGAWRGLDHATGPLVANGPGEFRRGVLHRIRIGRSRLIGDIERLVTLRCAA
jgi:hypothetical protein